MMATDQNQEMSELSKCVTQWKLSDLPIDINTIQKSNNDFNSCIVASKSKKSVNDYMDELICAIDNKRPKLLHKTDLTQDKNTKLFGSLYNAYRHDARHIDGCYVPCLRSIMDSVLFGHFLSLSASVMITMISRTLGAVFGGSVNIFHCNCAEEVTKTYHESFVWVLDLLFSSIILLGARICIKVDVLLFIVLFIIICLSMLTGLCHNDRYYEHRTEEWNAKQLELNWINHVEFTVHMLFAVLYSDVAITIIPRNVSWRWIWFLLLISLVDAATPSRPYDCNGWVVGTSSLPRATSRTAVGYDDITDTVWLLGGSGLDRQLVGYQRANDKFIDYGEEYLFAYGNSVPPNVVEIDGNGQYYSQYGEYLYILKPGGETDYPSGDTVYHIHRFSVRDQALNWKYYTIPSVDNWNLAGACLTTLDIDDGYLVINGGMYGGYYGSQQWIFNIFSNQWTNTASLNTGRDSHSCHGFDDTVFAIGGSNYMTSHNTVETWSFYDDEWIYTADKLVSISQYAPYNGLSKMRSVLYQHYIIIFGGCIDYNGGCSEVNWIIFMDAITHEIY
eukprot:948209_1